MGHLRGINDDKWTAGQWCWEHMGIPQLHGENFRVESAGSALNSSVSIHLCVCMCVCMILRVSKKKVIICNIFHICISQTSSLEAN